MVDPTHRLAIFASALDEVGISYLVMGGHAVRYYGVDRNTVDYDFHLSVPDWEALAELLQMASPFRESPIVEGHSWRPKDFRRFLVGRHPDGREEWLEFWRTNHLLPPFSELLSRSEEGEYGGRLIRFLGLSDLIHSKETERGSDWQDVALLEEIRDARNLARISDDGSLITALAELRSRTGFEAAQQKGCFAEVEMIRVALNQTSCPMTQACLIPFAGDATFSVTDSGMIGEILSGPLCQVVAGSAKHLALVEAVRRLYKQAAMAADRADKMKAMGK